MQTKRSTLIFFTLLVGAGLVAVAAPKRRVKTPPGTIKLVVMLVFDQFRGDYIARWHDLLGDDGFLRFEREGTWFDHCYYPYSCTITGPGHASLATGCSPERHGIVMNEWYDRAAADKVYCAGWDRYHNVLSVPLPTTPTKKSDATRKSKAVVPDDEKKPAKEKGGSPDRLLVSTFSDALKRATAGKAKVVALSLKDRSAILPGGHSPDCCYWFDDRTGTFCTSTYYRDRVHPWVAAFNRSRPAERWFGHEWVRMRDDIDYAAHSGPDDIDAEGLGVAKKQGRVFPHSMSFDLKNPSKDYFDAVETSPFGNDLLLDFAVTALSAEKLGEDAVPDFLSISFSSNDLIGHTFGPDSQEVLDVTLRSDALVRDLFRVLDRRIGRGRYAVAVSADHGVCPLPEVAIRQGIDARRVDPKVILADAPKYLRETLGGDSDKASAWFDKEMLPWVYLNYKAIKARGQDPAKVAGVLADWFRSRPEVIAAYTRQQLESPSATDDELLPLARKSYFADRCGDVLVVTKPYYFFSTSKTGTGHGTPHDYDRYVPLLVLGTGTPAGRCSEPVTPQAIVSALAQAAGVQPPSTAEAPIPAAIAE